MAYKEKLPKLPKLYKVIDGNSSCSGGRHTWDTSGGLNCLGGSHAGKPLRHCSIGFHLTTNWRNWYYLGRDVYTAAPGDGQVLLKVGYDNICEDKVVVKSVYLSQKNADPLAKLLKQFHVDLKKVEATFYTKSMRRGAVPKDCIRTRRKDADHVESFKTSFVNYNNPMDGDHRAAFNLTVRYILSALVESLDSKVSKKKLDHVHAIWKLWKAGWAVYGYENGKYLVK